MKLKTRMTIGAPVEKVWTYFTTPENWATWWGGVLKEVQPGWEKGGRLIWELGPPSVIDSIDPGRQVVIRSRWAVRYWTFNVLKGAILLEIEDEFIDTLPSSEAEWRDQWQSTLIKLKRAIEPSGNKESDSGQEVLAQGEPKAKQERPWWKFW